MRENKGLFGLDSQNEVNTINIRAVDKSEKLIFEENLNSSISKESADSI